MQVHLPRAAVLSAALLAAMVGAGCASRGPAVSPEEALTAGEWTLTELAGYAVLTGPDGRIPSLQLTAGETRVTGFTGCNRLTGRYTLEGDRLSFPEPLATTRMACLDPAVAQQEQRFLEALRQIRRFSIEGDQLTLHGDGEQPLARFTLSG